jgi:long-chain fatty acid transport protein
MIKSNNFKAILTIALMTTALPFKAFSSGYQMRYQSAETMGTAFASDVSGSKTASGFYNNPSQLLFMEDGIHASVEAMGLFPTGSFEETGGGNTKTDGFASTSVIPSIYYGQKLADKYGIVVSLTVPWATNTDYDKGWAGSSYALKTYLATYNLATSFVYSVNEKISVSVGPQIQLMKGELSSAIPAPAPQPTTLTIEGDNIAVGAVVSALYKATDSLKLGFTYKSRVKHNLSGDMTLGPAMTSIPGIGTTGDDTKLEISTPDVITIGATYSLTEKMDLHGTISWTGWSVLKELAVKNESTGGSLPPSITKWQNTTFVAVGTDYKHSDKWTFRGGLSYETGAPPDAYRTPRSVDSDRLTVGLGAGLALSESMTLNGALTQLFYTNAPTLDLPSPGSSPGVPLEGKYTGNMATAVRVGLSARF